MDANVISWTESIKERAIHLWNMNQLVSKICEFIYKMNESIWWINSFVKYESVILSKNKLIHLWNVNQQNKENNVWIMNQWINKNRVMKCATESIKGHTVNVWNVKQWPNKINEFIYEMWINKRTNNQQKGEWKNKNIICKNVNQWVNMIIHLWNMNQRFSKRTNEVWNPNQLKQIYSWNVNQWISSNVSHCKSVNQKEII